MRKLVERVLRCDPYALWLVLGDLNEPTGTRAENAAIAPLMPPFSVDLVARMPQAERWTFFDAESGNYSCPDALLAAPAVARRWRDAVPQALRSGMDRAALRGGAQRMVDVGLHRPHASDHAALVLELAGL